MTDDGRPYAPEKYKSIVQEQVILGYLTQGGVSYQDTEEMTPYERKIAYDTIKEIIESQNKMRQEAIDNKRSLRK